MQVQNTNRKHDDLEELKKHLIEQIKAKSTEQTCLLELLASISKQDVEQFQRLEEENELIQRKLSSRERKLERKEDELKAEIQQNEEEITSLKCRLSTINSRLFQRMEMCNPEHEPNNCAAEEVESELDVRPMT